MSAENPEKSIPDTKEKEDLNDRYQVEHFLHGLLHELHGKDVTPDPEETEDLISAMGDPSSLIGQRAQKVHMLLSKVLNIETIATERDGLTIQIVSIRK